MDNVLEYSNQKYLKNNAIQPKWCSILKINYNEINDRISNLPVLGKLLEIMSYCKLTDILRPTIKKIIDLFMGNMMRNLQEMDEMSGPRIIKTHIPFKLLNPKLLDTSKVSRFTLLISIAVPVFFSDRYLSSVWYIQLIFNCDSIGEMCGLPWKSVDSIVLGISFLQTKTTELLNIVKSAPAFYLLNICVSNSFSLAVRRSAKEDKAPVNLDGGVPTIM